MHIGLVKRSFRLQGGGERQLGYLIEGLLAQSHAVHLFSEQPPPGGGPAGLTYHALAAIPGPRAFRALSFALRVRSALRQAGLTVVQSFDRTLGQQIYRGVDTARFHAGVRRRFRDMQRAGWGVSAADLVLLFVGSGFHRKGLSCMIEAMGELRRRGVANVRLIVVGKGRLAPYQPLTRKVAVAEVVRF